MLPAYLLGTVAALAHATSIDKSAFAPKDIITKDVAIVGGGASGTYAAVRLREDYDKSIVVIEQDDHLGGHVNTYYDPASNISLDYGVLAYLQYGNSAAFFERFELPTKPYAPPVGGQTVYVNSKDGSNLSSYNPPAFSDVAGAVAKWVNLTAQYSDQLLPGYWDFFSPTDIPADLLLPFGEFAERYGLQAMVPTMAVISNVGVGGVEEVLTLYVYFAFGQPVASEFLNQSLFMPDGFSNSELYIRALQFLREDVMLQSRATAAERNADGVDLVVQGVDGCKKLIKAKRLIFTPPPSLDRLSAFDLDAREIAPLSTFTGTWLFAAVARIPSIPVNTTVIFTSPNAVPANHVNIRDMPFTLSLASAGLPDENLFEILISSNQSVSYEEAQGIVIEGVRNLTTSGTFPDADSTVDFVAFVDHNSILWRQSPGQLKAGIVQDVYGLQGYRSTWYAASLLSEDYTGNAWAFVDTILPRLLSGL